MRCVLIAQTEFVVWFVDARRHGHRRRRGERGRACLRPQRGRAAQGVLAWDAGEDQMSARGRPPTRRPPL